MTELGAGVLPPPVDAHLLENYAATPNAELPALLSRLRCAILDMDGVLYRGKAPLPGLVAFFAMLRERGVAPVMVTNNASTSAAEFAVKLAGMGVEVAPEQIVTSSSATAAYLRKIAPNGARVYVVGEPGLRNAVLGDPTEGFVWDALTPEYVVQGIDFHVTYEVLKTATLAIRRGATFIMTNPDPNFPMEEGLAPGAGSIGALLKTATGATPTIIGKPEPILYDIALERVGLNRADAVMIGDSLVTDIDGAQRIGIAAFLVLSGVTSLTELSTALVRGNPRPVAVFNGLTDLTAAWQAAPLQP